ncbi:MAG: hypothetical protein GC192_23125 [Bacteroidetes bacterium]|nr:hypothetical protein [Bacteroidota bacterium]
MSSSKGNCPIHGCQYNNSTITTIQQSSTICAMQNILITTLLLCCTLLVSCTKDDDVPQPTTTPGELAKPCLCDNLLIGYFEMEDCQLYLPTESPFSCQGYDILELSWNFEMHRVTFRSTDYRFCEAPVELWVYDGDTSPFAEWSCEATVVSAQLDFNGHELCLELDDAFLPCAFEKEDGFWFALAVE